MAGAPAEASSRRALSGVPLVAATAVVYVVAAKVGLSLAFVAAQVTTVWPPTGIALAALVLFEPRLVWIGIALGAFAANASQGEPIATAAGIAAGNTLEAVVGAWLLGLSGFHPAMARVRDALALVMVAAIATTLAATIGVVSLCAGGVQSWSSFSMLWWTWWVGDALGALVAAPLLLVWVVRQAPAPPARRFETIGLALVTVIVGTLAFTIDQQPPLSAYPLHYIVFPVVVWAALRFGPRGVTSVTFMVSTLAILYSVRGLEHLGEPSPHQRLFVLQLFMAVVAVTGLLLAAASAERDASRARGAIDLVRMQESEERLRLALDAGRMGVWDWNLVTDEVRWTDNLEAIHGLPPGTFGGTIGDFQEVVHPDDREGVSRAIENTLVAGATYDTEFRNVRADGSVGWMSAKGRVFRDAAGQPVRMLGVGMDVTDRRRLAAELEARVGELALADRRKDEFLAMLAHELRNPLAPMSTALHLLRVDGHDSDTLLAMLERQLRQLVRLVDDLLDVSRITQGKITLRTERVTIAEIVARALETVRPTIEGRAQRLDVLLPDEPIDLDADAARLAQVLANLLDNAAKYTPHGGTVVLTARREGSVVVVGVRDTGAGLPPEFLPHIFDLFVQGDHSLARSRGGLGIGLTIVRRLVELHGGRVQAKSAGLGLGSEFVVELPALPAEAGGRAVEAVLPATPARAAAGLRVLVVEDNLDAADSLAVVLGMWGHDVRVAGDAAAALDVAVAWPPAVVLSDIGLPGMDGYELAVELRRQPAMRGATLIALSGYGRDEDKRRAADAGFDHHLVKPPDLVALERLLAAIGVEAGTSRTG